MVQQILLIDVISPDIQSDNAICEMKEQLDILEQYKNSLIYEYVTGKREVLAND